jgi:hypothetical protein
VAVPGSFTAVSAGLVLSRDRLMGIGQAITMPLFFGSNAAASEGNHTDTDGKNDHDVDPRGLT